MCLFKMLLLENSDGYPAWGCSASASLCVPYTETRSACQKHHKLTFRPSRAPESRGTLPSFMRLLSKMRPIRRSPSLEGCHVTGCYKVRATTHLLFNNSSTWTWSVQTKANNILWWKGEVIIYLGKKSSHKLCWFVKNALMFEWQTTHWFSIL